jgi:hypothetical protein
MAYSQAPVEMDIYMELPQGIKTATGNSKDHVLKLLKNIYGQKQAGKVWNSFLVDKLTSLGYTSLLIDDCVFFRGDIIFMVYVDDGIFLGAMMTRNSYKQSRKSKAWDSTSRIRATQQIM